MLVVKTGEKNNFKEGLLSLQKCWNLSEKLSNALK